MLLLAIWRLQQDAYVVSIRKQIKSVTGKSWSVGALHVTLERMEKKGMIESHLTLPEKKRGGRSKRVYSLCPAGKKELLEIRTIQEAMWNNIPDLAGALS